MQNFRLNKLQLVALLALLFASAFALAQGIVTGSISGTVLDPSSAVVVAAKVTAQNIATGQTLTAETNDTGYFTFRSVPPGVYKVTIEAKGFRTVQVPQVEVQTAKDAALAAIKLDLTSAGETVEVVEAAPILETSTAQVTNTFDTQATADLPTGGGFDSLALYLPGIADTGSANFSNTNGVGISSNGLRGRSNNFQIDGQSNNDNSVSGPSIFLGNQDNLGEVSVITNDFSVEYGRASGSVVNYVTKSGTNQFHGSAFEYWTGSHFDSHDNLETSSTAIPRYVENRFGGTVGGPIYRNKAWFFGSAYGDRVRQAGTIQTSGSGLMPTPDGMTALAAAFPGNLGVAILDAIGPYAVAAGNPHPDGGNKTLTVSDGATNADIPFEVVARNPPSLFNDREITGKVDVQLTNKNRVGARYIFQQNILTAATGRFAAGAWVDIPSRSQQIALDWVHTFSGQKVNQLRYSFSRSPVPFEGGSFPSCTRANLFGCPTGVTLPSSLLSFGMQNNLPQGRTINNSQVQDNASWAVGRHLFKFGGEFYKQRSPNTFLPNANGTYSFSGAVAANPNFPGSGCTDQFPTLATYIGTLGATDKARVCAFSRMLGDIATLSLTDGPPKFNFKEYDLAFYFGDDWRVKENLTLNLGLRWEYSSQAINLLHDLSVANQAGSTPFWDTSLPASVTTVPSIPNNFKYFGPNIGFAWKPRLLGGSDKTVIRGGYRLTYDPAYYNMFLNVASAAPVVNAGTFGFLQGSACTAPCLPTTGFTGGDVRTAHFSDIPRGVNPGVRTYTQVSSDFHEPHTQNWSVGIQQELTNRLVLEVRYVGNHVTGNFQSVNANPALDGLVGNGFSSFIPAGVTPCATDGAPGFASQRADCNFTNVRRRENTAWSTYNGLQSEFRIREFHGLSGAASFTWSKTMDSSSEIFSTFTGGSSNAFAQNPFDINQAERSLSGLDFPKLASIYMVYELPFYRDQHGALGKVLGGWQANTAWHYSSGQLWTPLQIAGTNTSCQTSFDSAFNNPVSGCRPFVGNVAAPVGSAGICSDPTLADCGLTDLATGAPTTFRAVRWIYNDDNAAAFFGTPYGNSRRNPGVRGQNISAVNFSMFKTTKLGEKVSFRLEAQVYNLFNHQFRGVPDTFIDDAGSTFGNNFSNNSGGDYTNTTLNGTGRRRMILGGKITF
jgi:hypothetical protein